MPLTLFDILTHDGKSFAEAQQELVLSISRHLERLLNARRGTLVHLPDYGMPDLAQIYENLPYSIDDLVAETRCSIEKYEPRLRGIRVDCNNRPDSCNRLQLEISAEVLGGERVHFQTRFENGGATRVQMRRTVA